MALLRTNKKVLWIRFSLKISLVQLNEFHEAMQVDEARLTTEWQRENITLNREDNGHHVSAVSKNAELSWLVFCTERKRLTATPKLC